MSEQLSALMDGELSPDEMARQIGAMKTAKDLDQSWVAYHVLGDAMRRSPQLSLDFTARLAQQLAAEPTVLAPQRKLQTGAPRYAMPLAASVAAFSLVGLLAWQMFGIKQADSPIGLAAAPAATAETLQTVAAKAPQPVQFSRVVSNPYLLAHQEFSPSYAMEGIPAYVRTVSELQEAGR